MQLLEKSIVAVKMRSFQEGVDAEEERAGAPIMPMTEELLVVDSFMLWANFYQGDVIK